MLAGGDHVPGGQPTQVPAEVALVAVEYLPAVHGVGVRASKQ